MTSMLLTYGGPALAGLIVGHYWGTVIWPWIKGKIWKATAPTPPPAA